MYLDRTALISESTMRGLLIIFLFIYSSLGAQDQLTNGEIFNYEIGDIFHWYWSSSGDLDKRILTVIEKEFSENNDTVFYTYDRLRNYNYPDAEPPWGIFTHDTLTEYYTDLLEFREDYDSSTVDPDYFNNRTINYHYYGMSSGEGGTSIHSRFGEGLGRVYYNYAQTLSGFPSSWAEEHLVYYKKGEEEYGEPLVLSIEESSLPSFIKVYPNPCSDRIYWSITNENQEVEKAMIFDMTGNLIKSQRINHSEQGISVSEIESGIYLLKLKMESGVVQSRILIGH